MHIAAQTRQIIALLHQKTLVAPLEEVAAQAMLAVEEHRVSNQQPMHPAPEIWPVRLCHKMKMVRHELGMLAVGSTTKRGSGHALSAPAVPIINVSIRRDDRPDDEARKLFGDAGT